jgi:hypothetical protein
MQQSQDYTTIADNHWQATRETTVQDGGKFPWAGSIRENIKSNVGELPSSADGR